MHWVIPATMPSRGLALIHVAARRSGGDRIAGRPVTRLRRGSIEFRKPDESDIRKDQQTAIHSPRGTLHAPIPGPHPRPSPRVPPPPRDRLPARPGSAGGPATADG